ncbi:MAG: hypothetical protein ACRDE5_19145 [Ginsengibacter sp.]
MANNRIFLANKETKEFICIAKHLGGPWYVSNVIDKLSDFLNDPKNMESFWENEKCYEIIYESDDMKGYNNFLK